MLLAGTMMTIPMIETIMETSDRTPSKKHQ